MQRFSSWEHGQFFSHCFCLYICKYQQTVFGKKKFENTDVFNSPLGLSSFPSLFQTSDMSSGFLVNPLSSALNLGEGLLSPSVPDPHIMPPVVDIGADTCLGLRTGDPFLQSAIFNPQPSLSSPQPFLPHFPTLVPLVQPGTPPLPLTPQTLPFVSSEALRFGACKSSVITHTASATPTHSVPATTFSQGQGSLLAAQQLGGGMSYNLAVQTAVIQGQQLLQPHTTFSVPLASAGARPKKPQKIVPAPKPETVPLVLKNAFFAPGECA